MYTFIEKRLEICKKCPLMRMTEYGMKCDERRWISPDGTQTSYFKKDGWKKGCGCYLNSKARNLNNHCVCGKW